MFDTKEPELYRFSERIQAWGLSIRRVVATERIRSVVEALPGPRNRLYQPEAMEKADSMIIEQLTNSGWLPEKQPFSYSNIKALRDISPLLLNENEKLKDIMMVYDRLEGSNIIAVKKGTDEPENAIVIIAHHDTVKASQGANDNTASVAAILELARVLGSYRFKKSVVLAMPDMEELWLLGAIALVESLVASYKILGVINYETMGCVDSDPGSQVVPQGIDLLYKDQYNRIKANDFKGDFTCIIYNGKAKLTASMLGTALNNLTGKQTSLYLRDPNDLPVIGKLLGILVPTVRNFARSDHSRFWDAGIPAMMVTDTANFRYKHYHQPTDTPEKVDYHRIADIAAATATVIAETAELILNN